MAVTLNVSIRDCPGNTHTLTEQQDLGPMRNLTVLVSLFQSSLSQGAWYGSLSRAVFTSSISPVPNCVFAHRLL